MTGEAVGHEIDRVDEGALIESEEARRQAQIITGEPLPEGKSGPSMGKIVKVVLGDNHDEQADCVERDQETLGSLKEVLPGVPPAKGVTGGEPGDEAEHLHEPDGDK